MTLSPRSLLSLLPPRQVDFLPARDLSDEEMAAEMEAEAARSRGRRSCVAVVDGIERVFTTAYSLKFPTAGGHMMDVSVLFDGRETHHRVIVGEWTGRGRGLGACGA